MSHSDSTFFKPFAYVLGALVIFTLFIMFMANLFSPASPDDPLAMAEQRKSIAPVGRSRVAPAVEAPQAEASAAQTSSAAEATENTTEQTQVESESSAETSEEVANESATESTDAATAATGSETATETAAPVVENEFVMSDVPLNVKAAVATNCAGCHNPGLDGAAKPDDAEAWGVLAEKGVGELTASVINGKGKMPARAESSLSDSELQQAVQLMLVKATGSAGSVAGTASAATAATATGAATTATATAAAASQEESVAAATTEVPAEVKMVVDTTCAACHIAGVANAPKYGDKEAWAQRMEAGLDALTASAINGKGVMPPRGGSSLDDEQMKLAIEYILTK